MCAWYNMFYSHVSVGIRSCQSDMIKPSRPLGSAPFRPEAVKEVD
jgi:hypothetical protein